MIKKLKATLITQLKQGATPEKLSQSIVAGLLIGVFPLMGVTTILSGVAGALFKLNHIAVQAVTYAMYPVQLIMIPIYIKVVSLMIGAEDVPIRPDLILKLFAEDWLSCLKKYAWISLVAVILWTLVSAVIFNLLQKIFLKVVLKLKFRNT